LEAAESIATEIEQTLLDPTLLKAIERAKVDALQTSQWNAALDAYLEVAGKALGGLYFGRKGAAEAVCRQFGRPLCAESAGTIKEFLRSLQVRLDMQGVIESITGETFPRRASDEELLAEFRRHRAVVTALCKPVAPAGKSNGDVAIP